MKNLAKTLTIFALTLLTLLTAPQLQAGSLSSPDSAKGTDALEIHKVTTETMIRRGNSLVMDLVLPVSGTARLVVTDVNGREVWQQDLDFQAGQNRVKFRVGELLPGTYFLAVSSGDKTEIQAFAVR